MYTSYIYKYVYMYICMYVCIYTYTCIFTYTCITCCCCRWSRSCWRSCCCCCCERSYTTHIQVWVSVHVHMCVCAWSYVCVCMVMCVCVYEFNSTSRIDHVCISTHLYIHMYDHLVHIILCQYAPLYVNIYIYICICMYDRIDIWSCTCVHLPHWVGRHSRRSWRSRNNEPPDSGEIRWSHSRRGWMIGTTVSQKRIYFPISSFRSARFSGYGVVGRFCGCKSVSVFLKSPWRWILRDKKSVARAEWSCFYTHTYTHSAHTNTRKEGTAARIYASDMMNHSCEWQEAFIFVTEMTAQIPAAVAGMGAVGSAVAD